LQTLNERIGTLVSDPVAGVVAFAGDLIVFVLTVVVFCLLGRIVVVPAVTRLLDARNVQPTLAKPAQKLTLAAVVFVAVAVGFAVAGFGNLLTPLAAIAVTLTLAIGFASQDVIGNPVAGVFLIADPKTRIGDWVEWDDRKGSIEDISFRVSRVRTFDSGLVTVPNSEPANTAIVNPAAKDELRITFTFGVGDEDDLDHAQRVIIGEAENHDDILDEPAASTRVTELADSYVGIQSRFRIDAPSRADFARIRSEYVQYSKRPFLSVIGGVRRSYGPVQSNQTRTRSRSTTMPRSASGSPTSRPMQTAAPFGRVQATSGASSPSPGAGLSPAPSPLSGASTPRTPGA
jgi:small-conductance mechanosensitive channel